MDRIKDPFDLYELIFTRVIVEFGKMSAWWNQKTIFYRWRTTNCLGCFICYYFLGAKLRTNFDRIEGRRVTWRICWQETSPSLKGLKNFYCIGKYYQINICHTDSISYQIECVKRYFNIYMFKGMYYFCNQVSFLFSYLQKDLFFFKSNCMGMSHHRRENVLSLFHSYFTEV